MNVQCIDGIVDFVCKLFDFFEVYFGDGGNDDGVYVGLCSFGGYGSGMFVEFFGVEMVVCIDLYVLVW